MNVASNTKKITKQYKIISPDEQEKNDKKLTETLSTRVDVKTFELAKKYKESYNQRLRKDLGSLENFTRHLKKYIINGNDDQLIQLMVFTDYLVVIEVETEGDN